MLNNQNLILNKNISGLLNWFGPTVLQIIFQNTFSNEELRSAGHKVNSSD